MTDHPLHWVTPSPLWGEAARLEPGLAVATMSQPTILRFARDSFMEDLLALLEADPSRLAELRLRYETWRGPLPEPPPTQKLTPAIRALSRRQIVAARASTASTASTTALLAPNSTGDIAPPPLKLYQPAHQRFYLVAACLVCGIPGLPNRTLDPGRGERATFVVRRLRPKQDGVGQPSQDPSRYDEYAFVSNGRTAAWQKVVGEAGGSAATVVPGEEQTPLFAMTFAEDDGRKRRLFAGLVPVGKREAYLGAPEAAAPGAPPPDGQQPSDPRLLLLQTTVTGPWKNLIEQAGAALATTQNDDPPDELPTTSERQRFVREVRERLQTVSWYTLLDLGKYLQDHLPRVWATLNGESVSPQPTTPELALVAALNGADVGSTLASNLISADTPAIYDMGDIPDSLADALALAVAAEGPLEAVEVPYDRTAAGQGWPGFIFPLADPLFPFGAPLASTSGSPVDGVSDLEELIVAALPAVPAAAVPAPALLTQPTLDPRGSDWFVLRCVLERPECGPLGAFLVSAPTTPFQLAGFFDPDAPARPIRIALPVDISPAGLRKFDKNTVLVMSDLLCGQVQRMKGLTLGDLVRSVLPWPLHKDLSVPAAGPCKDDAGLNVGMICALSIPIVTICALILLIIIVSLLDIIFRWLPYFFLCFPLPRFRAKGGG